MRVLLEFGSHHYWENYAKCKYFCPNCGNKDVWEEQDGGDYYEGVEYICVSCDYKFTLPTLRKCDSGWSLVPEQLRNGTSNKPVSPKGN